MNNRDDFFIGWKDKMSDDTSSFIKRFLFISGFIAVLIAFAVVRFQRPFASFIFNLGDVTEFTGIYHSSPVPILEVSSSDIPDGFSNSILLVGYGKFGAEGIIENFDVENSLLDGSKITLRGTLIYGDGKTVLELTEKEKSLVKVFDSDILQKPRSQRPDKEIRLVGEILDPKCYFGVMKPGEGKIHKSCAIRCISGGIPPVFRSIENGTNDYYLVLGSGGEKINDDLLEYVAEQVRINGKVNHLNGWDVLYVNTADIAVIK